MKIMLVIRWPVGGIKTYLQYIYKHDVLRKHSYVIVAPGAELKDYISTVFSHSPHTFYPTDDNSLDLLRVARKALNIEKPDLVHSHGTTAGMISSLVLLFSVKPHLLTTHDVFFESQFSGFKGKLKKLTISTLLNQSTAVNPCGFDAAANFKAFFPAIGQIKIKPIRNGIDIEKFNKKAIRNLRDEARISHDVVLLGFFGRFMSQKGFDLLVDALKIMREKDELHKIHVACFGWGGFIREEQEKIKNDGLSSFFTFFEQTNDMPSALRGVDIAIMPSRWEACPLLPMEALVVGTPIIASDCVGMKEVCQDSPAQLFTSGSSLNLSEVISKALLDLELLRSEAERFKLDAITKFDSKNTAQSLNALYESMLK